MDKGDLSLRAALVENRLEDFVRQAQTNGVELRKGSEFERGLALLQVQRSQSREEIPMSTSAEKP
jgi:hypothetical protein